ncbi:hypothetical protein Scep_012377 [Stephania cephalantha]|uniref:Uncharacterized protein n=1 Tax=Stephania cephalantha TaxID=152367 RepID=A0AAP0P7F8_9MAGN
MALTDRRRESTNVDDAIRRMSTTRLSWPEFLRGRAGRDGDDGFWRGTTQRQVRPASSRVDGGGRAKQRREQRSAEAGGGRAPAGRRHSRSDEIGGQPRTSRRGGVEQRLARKQQGRGTARRALPARRRSDDGGGQLADQRRGGSNERVGSQQRWRARARGGDRSAAAPVSGRRGSGSDAVAAAATR